MKSTTTQVRGREPPALPPSLPEAASGSVPHPVCDGDGVEEHKHAEEGPAVAEAGGQDVLHPRTALHLQRAAAAAGSRSGQQRADGVRQGTLRAARTPPPQRAALQVAAAAAPPSSPKPVPRPRSSPWFIHAHTHTRTLPLTQTHRCIAYSRHTCRHTHTHPSRDVCTHTPASRTPDTPATPTIPQNPHSPHPPATPPPSGGHTHHLTTGSPPHTPACSSWLRCSPRCMLSGRTAQ